MQGQPEIDNAPRQQLVLLNSVADGETHAISPLHRRDLVLLALLGLVAMIAVLYNFVIATPRYASEMSFVVRTLDRSHQRFSFLNVGSGGSGDDDSHAIVAYIESRDMLASINADQFVSRIFSAEGVDAFSAFPSWLAGAGEERFFKHVQDYINVRFDAGTGITSVSVQAFTASDAKRLAERLLAAAEAKVNQLNARAHDAMVSSAEAEYKAADADLGAQLAELAAVQRRTGVIEPGLEAGAAIGVSSDSASALSQINVELANTIRVAPRSPLIQQLQTRRAAILADLGRQLAARSGDKGSLAERIGPYMAVSARLNVAEKRLLGASLALTNARNTASSNRIYIEWISRPGSPDIPAYPRKWFNLLAVVLVAAGLLWIVRSLSDLVMADD